MENYEEFIIRDHIRDPNYTLNKDYSPSRLYIEKAE